VCWCAFKDFRPGLARSKEFIPVAELVRTTRGAGSAIFQKQKHMVKRAGCCFTIEAAARTLDLECRSEAEAEQWAADFALLCAHKLAL
jgi:hypothetical protein